MTRLADEDVPFAPVNSLGEVSDDPQVQHLRTFTRLSHPVEGPQRAIERPVRIDGKRGPMDRAAPTLGEHTDEILKELGLSGARIEALRSGGVFGSAT